MKDESTGKKKTFKQVGISDKITSSKSLSHMLTSKYKMSSQGSVPTTKKAQVSPSSL
jgi:hypothetical protein